MKDIAPRTMYRLLHCIVMYQVAASVVVRTSPLGAVRELPPV